MSQVRALYQGSLYEDFHLDFFSEWSLVQPGLGVMVINNEGIPLKTTLDSSTTVNITKIELQMYDIYHVGNMFVCVVVPCWLVGMQRFRTAWLQNH